MAATEQTIKQGYFSINENPNIISEFEFNSAATLLKNTLKELNIISEKKSKNVIIFSKNEKLDLEEYTLDINSGEIIIEASSHLGAIYACQSLKQLILLNNRKGSVKIQSQFIKDSPRFKYRGMHLDVGRHMYSVEFIKKYIDGLSMLKFNNFHWHLTEDQGWRIEIEKYPELNNVGSYRDSTLIGHYTDKPWQFDKTRYGGYYTQDEVKDIVAFAESREILIIPEIEMPGHAQAAIASYPFLSCRQEKINVATTWGVFEDIYCTRESTFNFLEDVLDEVINLFPGKYIHIGGDEAPKSRWKECDNCQAVISKEKLVDEHGLQSYFIKRIEKYVNSNEKKIIAKAISARK